MAVLDTTASAVPIVLGPSLGIDGASAYQLWLSAGNTGTLADYLASQKGADGADGTNGVDGAGAILALVASVAVLPCSAVVPDGNGGCRPADPTNTAHRGQVLGLTMAGSAIGASVTIQASGDMAGVTGAFTAGQTLYIAPNGTLTATPPVAGWVQSVGVATTSSRIVINLGTARTILPGGALILPGSPLSALLALLAIFDRLPTLPADPANYPAAGGLFRNGDANGYSLTRIYPTTGGVSPLDPILLPLDPTAPDSQAALTALLQVFEGGLPTSDAGLPVGAFWSNGGIPTRVKVAS